MRVLVVGAGGVGSSAALIAARRDFFESWLVADYDLERAQALVARLDDARFSAVQIDASDAEAVADLVPGQSASPTCSTPSTRATSCPSSTARSRAGPTTWTRP